MGAALRAGALYGALVFLAGFALGTIRVLIAPRIGELGATALEVPVMLAISWGVCAWLVSRCGVPAEWGARAAMGGVAFSLLMMAEVGLSVFAFGRPFDEYLDVYRTAGGQLGLAAQLLFGAFPVIQLMRRGR